MDENKAPTVPYVYVHDTGAVHDALPVKVVSSCNLNIYTFPFDIQNCSLTFNSYIYYNEIQILLGRSAEEITMNSKTVMTTMGEWELLDITAKKLENDDLTGFYTDQLTFHVRVRRRATMYVMNLLLPSCFLITVDLFSFLLPPQNIDRSSFKMTLILGYTVFLLIMNDLLPVTGNIIPLIVFFSLCLALMVASLLETILITNLLCNSADFSPVPGWIKVLVLLQELRSLSSVLRAIRSQMEQQQQQKEKQSSEDWIQVGFIIDRLLFGLYIVFISISFITIIIIWVNSYNQ
uniref:Neurotransmitter-gated ion-channel ligand-binding domain-containing protein n=1 Tax=Kryptolebias marmoratus TaxID=37003 RepID=A0A3Q3AJM8_KRYMA